MPANGEREDLWQTLGSHFSHEVKSALYQIGHAEVVQSDANLAMATDEANAIAHALRAYADYRARPWIGPDGRRVQVPVINTGDSISDLVDFTEHELFEPNAPLTRPGTNADWIDPLINLVSVGAMAAGLAFRLAGLAAEAIDTADVVALSADTTAYRATFGKALTNDYRATFFESNPELQSRVIVHHAMPQ